MTTSSAPLVSVLLAAHDAEAYLAAAIASILGQTLGDLELIVVDDGSTDGTADVLATIGDPRLRVLRNDPQLGLAASLNRGLDDARGRYVARLDADDLALQTRLERQLEWLRTRPSLGVVGSAVLEVDGAGRPGRVHVHPRGAAAVRWHALFTSPFFHPSVMLDREVLDRHELRYDTEYGESEDYELWDRLLRVAEGDNIAEPLILYRLHPGQASQRRRELQRELQSRVSMRAMGAVAPGLDEREAELARRLGGGEPVGDFESEQAVDAFLRLLEAFEAANGRDRRVRRAAAGALARRGAVVQALRLDPRLPAELAAERVQRRAVARRARAAAAAAAVVPADATRPVRVVIVSPEPTPFRSRMFDVMSKRPELDLHVIYAGRTIFDRTWTIEHDHSREFLEGVRIPGVRRAFRHEYPISTGIFDALARARPEVVVVSGWSTFAAQAAALWCKARRVPYVLLVESNDADPRPLWRRVVKGTVVPPFVKGATRVFAIGALARESAIARGARPEHVSWFANTVDVPDFAARADALAPERARLRTELGAGPDDVVVLSIARLSPEKGLETLVRAAAAAADPRILVVIAGEGPDREAIVEIARALGVRLVVVGNLPWERIVERYVPADVFALVSLHEPWGVVVNEAAACGLPLLLSNRVGAAADLLVDGENGFLVAAGDVGATAEALALLARDAEFRAAAGARSRELMHGWSYEPSIENFIAVAREAAASA